MNDLALYNTVESILHFGVLLGFVLGIIFWSWWAKKHKSRRNYAVPPILFFLHAMLYFVLTLMNALDPLVGAIWTDLVAIHGITVIIGGAYIMLKLVPEDK